MNALARAIRQADNLINTIEHGENVGDVTLVEELRTLRATIDLAAAERPVDLLTGPLSDDDIVEQADRELGGILTILHDLMSVDSVAIDIPTESLCAVLAMAERLHRVSCQHRGTRPAPARRIGA